MTQYVVMPSQRVRYDPALKRADVNRERAAIFMHAFYAKLGAPTITDTLSEEVETPGPWTTYVVYPT